MSNSCFGAEETFHEVNKYIFEERLHVRRRRSSDVSRSHTNAVSQSRRSRTKAVSQSRRSRTKAVSRGPAGTYHVVNVASCDTCMYE